jgi:hypothetical protein
MWETTTSVTFNEDGAILAKHDRAAAQITNVYAEKKEIQKGLKTNPKNQLAVDFFAWFESNSLCFIQKVAVPAATEPAKPAEPAADATVTLVNLLHSSEEGDDREWQEAFENLEFEQLGNLMSKI